MRTSRSVAAYLQRRGKLIDEGNQLAAELARIFFDEAVDGTPGQGPRSRHLRDQLVKASAGLQQGDAALNAILAAVGEPPLEDIGRTVAAWTDHVASALHARALQARGVPLPGQIDPNTISRAQYEAMDPTQRAQGLRALGVR